MAAFFQNARDSVLGCGLIGGVLVALAVAQRGCDAVIDNVPGARFHEARVGEDWVLTRSAAVYDSDDVDHPLRMPFDQEEGAVFVVLGPDGTSIMKNVDFWRDGVEGWLDTRLVDARPGTPRDLLHAAMQRRLAIARPGEKWALVTPCTLDQYSPDAEVELNVRLGNWTSKKSWLTFATLADRDGHLRVRFEDGAEGWIDPHSVEAIRAPGE